jgi:hypothetical protein
MGGFLGIGVLLWLLGDLTLPTAAAANPPLPLEGDEILATPGLAPEILALLKETKEKYGADALLLQMQLLQRAIQAGSILPAGVRVRGVEAEGDHRYLVFYVETGIVYHTEQTSAGRRLDHVWTEVVVPAVGALTGCDVPGDGIAVELTYTHRSYADAEELARTVADRPGVSEQLWVRLLCQDLLAFTRKEFDGPRLFALSGPRLNGMPFTAGLPGAP